MALFEKNRLAWLISFILVAISIFNGGYSFITADTLVNAEMAKFMLSGKYLYRDLFETNHPMPIYIIWVAIYISSKLSWLHDILAVKTFILLLSLLSVVLTHRIMSLSDEYKDKYFRFIFIISLSCIIFLLPLYNPKTAEIGQKSHLFFILFLPYLHSFLLTDQQRKNHPYLMLIIGLFAGIGLCVKVYFFIIAIILEIYRMLNRKSFYSAFRIESFAIAFVVISFFFSILIFTPEYITEIIPIATIAYSEYAYESRYKWIGFLLQASPSFIFLLLCVSVESKTPQYRSLLKVAIIASFISILPQVSKWAHTALPTLGLIMLLVMATISDIVRNVANNSREKKTTFKQNYCIVIALITIAIIVNSIASNISNYQPRKERYYKRISADYFISLSEKYGDKGGAYFLTRSFKPQVYSWIYGNFSLQGYFHSMHVLNGLNDYNKKHPQSQKAEIIKNNTLNRIINDIKTQDPALIIVQIRSDSPLDTKNTVDYIELLSQKSKFLEIFQKYQLKETISSESKIPMTFEIYLKKDLR